MPARDALAARQAALVAALVGGAEVPEGLDARRVRIQAAALLRKRGRLVALAAPELAAALGTGFTPAFAAYATGRPARGGSARDAAEFARHLLAGSPYARDRAVRRPARRAARRSLSLARMPLGATKPVREPVWNWGTGRGVIESTGQAAGQFGIGFVFNIPLFFLGYGLAKDLRDRRRKARLAPATVKTSKTEEILGPTADELGMSAEELRKSLGLPEI